MSSQKHPAIYIMANKKGGTLYTGVTSNLPKRAYEHRTGTTKGFTSRYNCKLLVYYEVYEDMEHAILREKQLKAGPRKQKLTLINTKNPNWDDLYDSLF